jgi:hypothetical protein
LFSESNKKCTICSWLQLYLCMHPAAAILSSRPTFYAYFSSLFLSLCISNRSQPLSLAASLVGPRSLSLSLSPLWNHLIGRSPPLPARLPSFLPVGPAAAAAAVISSSSAAATAAANFFLQTSSPPFSSDVAQTAAKPTLRYKNARLKNVVKQSILHCSKPENVKDPPSAAAAIYRRVSHLESLEFIHSFTSSFSPSFRHLPPSSSSGKNGLMTYSCPARSAAAAAAAAALWPGWLHPAPSGQ